MFIFCETWHIGVAKNRNRVKTRRKRPHAGATALSRAVLTITALEIMSCTDKTRHRMGKNVDTIHIATCSLIIVTDTARISLSCSPPFLRALFCAPFLRAYFQPLGRVNVYLHGLTCDIHVSWVKAPTWRYSCHVLLDKQAWTRGTLLQRSIISVAPYKPCIESGACSVCKHKPSCVINLPLHHDIHSTHKLLVLFYATLNHTPASAQTARARLFTTEQFCRTTYRLEVIIPQNTNTKARARAWTHTTQTHQ
jgi:hypothetical protein